jgi:hypothetical protein
MKLFIKEGVYIKFIDEIFLRVVSVVTTTFSIKGKKTYLTSACDGVHGKNSYHPEGWGWDFDVLDDVITNKEYLTIRNTLKMIDPYYDLVFEKTPGNEHIHVEYDVRRKALKENNSSSKELDSNIKSQSEENEMKIVWKDLIILIAKVLSPVLAAITKKFRDEIEVWVKKKYTEALETDNPWDDFFFEILAAMLKVDIK